VEKGNRSSTLPNVTGLDGLRGVALIAVLGFHLEIPGFAGGFLGVSLFFALSGYLITQLLLREHEVDGRVSLRRFWGRRLRRLAPASIVVLLVLGILGSSGVIEGPRLRGDLFAGLAYFFNWRVASAGESYAELFASAPSPILHFWSLAIEEQFYFVFPLLMVLLLRTARRSWLVGVISALTLASFVTGLLTTSRDWFYYGTHVRAVEILVGVLLALHLPVGSVLSRRSRRAVEAVAGLAFVAFVVIVWRGDVGQAWVYGGGLVGVALLGVAMVAAVVVGGTWSRLASWRPLVAVGRMSYGIYLVHWPVIVVLDADRLGHDGVLLAVTRLAVTAAIAVASYQLIENPIRHRRRLRAPRAALAAFVVSAAVTAAVTGVVPSSAPAALAGVDAPTEIVDFDTAPETGSGTMPGSTTVAPPRATVRFVTSDADVAEPFVAALVVADPSVAADVTVLPEGCPLGSAIDEVPGCPDHASATDSVGDPDVIVLLVGVAERELLAARVERRLSLDSPGTSAPDTSAPGTSAPGTSGDSIPEETPADRKRRTDAEVSEAERLAAELVTPFVDTPLVVVDLVGGDFLESGLLNADLTSSEVWLEVSPSVDDFIERSNDVLALVSVTNDRASVVVIGDSVSFGLAQSLDAVADDRYDVVWAGGQNCPLVETHEVSWGGEMVFEMERCPTLADWRPLWERTRPDLVLIVSSVPEQSDQRYEPDGEWFRVGDDEFALRHDEAMAELVEITEQVGGRILFFDSPYIVSGAFENALFAEPERIDRWNEAIVGWSTVHPIVEVLDWRSIVEAAEAVPGSLREDGVHMQYEDLERLVRENLLAILDSELAEAAG